MGPSTAIAIPEQWTKEIQRYEAEKCNILAPRELGVVPPYHTPRLAVVEVNPDPDAGDVYALPGGKKFGLSKVALDRISQAAAITWLPELCGRVDDGHDPNIVRYRAVGRIKDLSGQWRTIVGEKEIDLVAIEDELADSVPRRDWIQKLPEGKRAQAVKDAVDKEMIQFRKHKLARAQSGAMNRAIRSALALRSGYSREEISRPFVLPKIVFTPDYSDPEVKRFMLADATGHVADLYGPQPMAALPPALPAAPEEDPVQETTGTVTEREEPFLPDGHIGEKQEPEPDPDEMRFQTALDAEQAAGSAEVKAEAVQAQLDALGRLMARKLYRPERLKRPLSQFSREERAGFARHLLAMPDAAPPPAPKAEPAQAALPWDR